MPVTEDGITMLHGTQEEYDYHTARAEHELAQAESAQDAAASFAHRSLATMHLTRSELVAALQKSKDGRSNGPTYRVDKES